MTRAQWQVYNRLGKKQVNRQHDVLIVEESNTAVTFWVAFPGIYVTYDSIGKLLETETQAMRKRANRLLARPGGQREIVFGGELGS